MQGNAQSNRKYLLAVVPAAHVADVTSSAQEVRGFTECDVLLPAGVSVLTASTVVKVTECETSGGTYTDVPGAVFPAIVLATDNDIHLGRIQMQGRMRYFKVVVDYTGNGSTEIAPLCVILALSGPRDSALCAQTYDFNVQG